MSGSRMPTTGLHSGVLLKSSLEFPAGGVPRIEERNLAKPPTLFQPHAQSSNHLPPQPHHPLHHHDGGGTSRRADEVPSPSESESHGGHAIPAAPQRMATQISVSSRPRQWLQGGQQPAVSSLLLSPRESSTILAAARVLGEHGAANFRADDRRQAEVDGQGQGSAWQLLKAEQLEKDRIITTLKAREDEIDSLHELLWCSEVAPTQARIGMPLRGLKVAPDSQALYALTPHTYTNVAARIRNLPGRAIKSDPPGSV